jgi:hypothetical protein
LYVVKIISELVEVILAMESLDNETRTLLLLIKELLDSIKNKSEDDENQRDKRTEDKRQIQQLILPLLSLIYKFLPAKDREQQIRELFQKLNKAKITNISNADLEQILLNLKTGKPIFKDILNPNVFGNLSQKQEDRTMANGFASNQIKGSGAKGIGSFFSKIKNNPLAKPFLAIASLVGSAVFLAKVVTKPIFGNRTSSKGASGTGTLGEGTAGIKTGEKDLGKNKGTENIVEVQPKTKLASPEGSRSTAEPRNDNEHLTKDEGEKTSGENHSNKETEQKDSDIANLDVGKGTNAIEQNGIEELGEDKGLKQDGTSEKPDRIEEKSDEEIIEPEDLTTVPENYADQTQDIGEDNGIEDNTLNEQQNEDLDFLPEFDMFGRDTDGSLGDRFAFNTYNNNTKDDSTDGSVENENSFTEGIEVNLDTPANESAKEEREEKPSHNTPADDEHILLGDLRWATKKMIGTIEEEDAKKRTPVNSFPGLR